PVDERHGHRLAFAVTEAKAIAARKLGRFVGASFELVHHLAFGKDDDAKRDLEAQLLRLEDHLHLAHADFAGEGVRSPVAALRRIAESQQEAFVPARQRLQAQIAIGGEGYKKGRGGPRRGPPAPLFLLSRHTPPPPPTPRP